LPQLAQVLYWGLKKKNGVITGVNDIKSASFLFTDGENDGGRRVGVHSVLGAIQHPAGEFCANLLCI